MTKAEAILPGVRTIPITSTPISWTPSEQLERMIDSQGLGSVLEMIREICYDKANHIAVVWQDMPLAKRWIAYAIRVNNVVQAIIR
jgi:hypothetical protein